MEILGYASAILIGVALGLIGGGGSILTVPVLVYLFAVDAVLATAYSLFIVGLSAGIGAFNALRKGLVNVRVALIFSVPSVVAVYLTRLWLVPSIPDPITVFGASVAKDLAIMLFFAGIMIAAAVAMLRPAKETANTPSTKKPIAYPLVMLEGLLVGTLTGIVGAGGGFLIIPALVLLARLPMKVAVGTSLLIISAKSLIGFIGDVQSGQPIDWTFLGLFTFLAVAGILLGGYISKFVPGRKLRSGFALFVLVMAVYILIQELL